MARVIHTGDLHLTARPQDEYRWEIFPWLRMQARSREAHGVFINGDLTDQKDNHPASLVNRVIDELRQLAEVAPVYILKGNHDYIDHLNPFFRFLGGLSRKSAGIRFFTEPEELELWGARYLFLPHHRAYRRWWNKYDFRNYDRILIHQAIKGAVMPGGYELEEGASFRRLRRCPGLVIAGDIHVPQTLGPVHYCGSPYPINFGDDFQPRVLFDDDGRLRSIRRSCIRKAALELSNPEDILAAELSEGDLVRVTLRIPRYDFPNWERYRAAVIKGGKKIGVKVCGVDLKEAEEEGVRVRIKGKREARKGPGIVPADWVRRYCKKNKVNRVLTDFGLTLVNGGRP